MTGTTALGRRARAAAAFVIALSALLALGGLAVAATDGVAGAVAHGSDHVLPFSFD